VRDWLLLVGAEYNIDEAHFQYRPDDENKQRRPHYIYWFEDSSDPQPAAGSMDCSTYTGNDKNVVLIRPWVRTLVIQCVDHEDGQDVLESTFVSIEHPVVNDILLAGRGPHNTDDAESRFTAIQFISINNLTENDETDIDYKYEMRLSVRRHASFSLTRDNDRVRTLSISGTITNDSGDTLDVEIEDTIA
jgi:hypothetical protein